MMHGGAWDWKTKVVDWLSCGGRIIVVLVSFTIDLFFYLLYLFTLGFHETKISSIEQF
jgi:hypothetical protein